MKQRFFKNPYPQGLFVFCFVESLFMAAQITINALLVLYLTEKIHLPTKEAYATYAAFASLFFSASLLGGFLGGRYDHKLAIIIGGILAGIGGYFVAVPQLSFIYVGLASFIIGGGLMIPNLNCIMGRLFSRSDALRDSGFTIVYMGMNLGGFIAAASSGFIARYFGYSTTFTISMSMIVLSLLFFLLTYKKLEFYQEPGLIPYKPEYTLANVLKISLISTASVPVVAWLLAHAKLSNTLLIITGAVISLIVIVIALRYTGKPRKDLFVFLLFTVLAVVFWSLYMLGPSVLTIFVNNNVDRHIGPILIPTSSVYSLNPFFIVLLGVITSLFFLFVSKKGKGVSLSQKFSTGIINMGLGYLVLVVATQFHNAAGYIAFYWIVLSYALQTLGELFIGPIGFAMVGSLVPPSLEGLMMGVWQLSTGVAGAVSGFLASITVRGNLTQTTNPLLTNQTFSQFFGLYGLFALIIGTFIVVVSLQVRRIQTKT